MEYEIHPELDAILNKLAKKDPVQLERVLNKIEEIIVSKQHYKNLRKPLQKYKRVHIGSFVLIFREKQNVICFRYFDHHDKIYR